MIQGQCHSYTDVEYAKQDYNGLKMIDRLWIVTDKKKAHMAEVNAERLCFLTAVTLYPSRH